MINTPLVSVVMSVYNGERYLAQAIDSILCQTYTNFEYVIIDDGSTDRTSEILSRYMFEDARIRVIHQENIGLTKSLNKAIGIAKGRLIARMDSDDISFPRRLEAQIDFLTRNPDHLAIGTSGVIIDENGTNQGPINLSADANELRVRFLADNYMIHGSVVFRKDIGVLYDESIRYAQDYDLWVRLLAIGDLANLDEKLYMWRQHKGGISEKNRTDQQKTAQDVSFRHFGFLAESDRQDIVLDCYLRRLVSGPDILRLRCYLLDKARDSSDAFKKCEDLVKSKEYYMSEAFEDLAIIIKFLGPCAAAKKLFLSIAVGVRKRLQRLIAAMIPFRKSL
jgi:glycosyltransferase involved in cell wall biosynthesis